MGLIITELKHRKPELVYFDDSLQGEYPKEAPFTISELEEIYPCASGKSKEDEAYRNEALEATHLLQQGKPGYHGSLESHYECICYRPEEKLCKLNVSPLISGKRNLMHSHIFPDMVEKMKKRDLHMKIREHW